MKNKKFTIIITLLLVITTIVTGCFTYEEESNNEDKKISLTSILNLNEIKILSINNANYEITIFNEKNGTIYFTVNSNSSVYKITSGETIDIDSDQDGTNDLSINITPLTNDQFTVVLTTTTSLSNYRYITDDLGTKVKIPKKLDKIISLAPSITEILFSLELGGRIIGRDSASNHPEEAQNIDIVSTYEGVDIETILVKDPDIIFMDKSLDASEINYNLLQSYGFNVFRLYPKKLDHVIENIELLGRATDTKTTANALADALATRIETVKTRDSSEPTVLHVIYFDGSSSPWVATSSTFSGDLIQIAGGKPAIIDESGLAIQITVEEVIDLDPDIIFTSQDQTWPTPSRDAIMSDDIFEDLNAVNNDMVIDVNADLVDRPGPRLVDGLELISSYISS
jgi:iron complex transport system substrate-binding protein